MKSAGIEFIREEVSGMAWDKYDPWGSLRGAQFDIAEAWYGETSECLPGYTPARWFSVQDWESERAERLNGAMEHEIITRDDVEYWWRILDRMEALVIAAGRDY